MPGTILALQILETPVVDVDRKDIFIDQTSAKRRFWIRMLHQVHVTRQQVLPKWSRNVVGVRGINIAEEHERPQYDFPVFASKFQNPCPFELALGPINNVGDVRTV